MNEKESKMLQNNIIRKALRASYFRDLWKEVKCFDDISYLPPTSGEVFKMSKERSLAVSDKKISYYFFSGGSTNKPKMIPFTKKEWFLRSNYRKECYKHVGINVADRVAIVLPFGPWVAGPSVQEALMQIGCKIFPLGPIDTIEQMMAMIPIFKKHDINVVITAPSYVQKMIFFLDEMNEKIFLEKVITSGEYVSESLRGAVSKNMHAEIYSSYASSEGFIGIECQEHSCFHFDPNEIHIDVVDEYTFKPTKGRGLLLVTIYKSEAIPIIRYSIGDIGKIRYDSCKCGSLLPRVELCGRMNETFCVAGAVNVNPLQLREIFAMLSFPVNFCKIELDNFGPGRDLLKFFVESNSKRVLENCTHYKNEFIKILPSISIDFSDVLYHKLILCEVDIRYVPKSGHSGKMKIKVVDNRKYVR